MPRMARVVLPHIPHHVVQRGQLTGNQRFVDEVEQIIGYRIERRSPDARRRAGRERMKT